MSVPVRNLGLNAQDTDLFGGRLALTSMTGSSILIMSDTNQPFDPNSGLPFGGDKSGVEKIYVYESTDYANWTLKATLTPPDGVGRLTAAINAMTSDISVYWMSQNRQRVYHQRVTFPTWTIQTRELVADIVDYGSTAGRAFTDFDADVSGSTNIIGVLWHSAPNPTAQLNLSLLVRNATNNIWWRLWNRVLSAAGNTRNQAVETVTVAIAGRFQPSGSSIWQHVLAVAAGWSSSATDQGVQVFTSVVAEGTTNEIGTTGVQGTYAKGEGSAPTSIGTQARLARFFRASNGDVYLAIAHSVGNRAMGVVRCRVREDGSWGVLTPYAQASMGTSQTGFADKGLAINYCNGVITWMAVIQGPTSDKCIGSMTAKLATASTWDIDSYLSYFQAEQYIAGNGVYMIGSGGHINNDLGDFKGYASTLFYTQNGWDQQVARFECAYLSGSPREVKPANNSQIADASPTFSARADTDRRAGQSPIRIEWQIASDANMTTNVITFISDTQMNVVQTILPNVYSEPFFKKLPDIYSLSARNWWVRARMVDRYGNRSDWSAEKNSFVLYHPPTTIGVSPSGGATAFNDGQVTFQWIFSDSYVGDYQTGVDIQVYRRDTGELVHQTGWIIQSDTYYTATLSASLKGIDLYWQARTQDVAGDAGPWSNAQLFNLMDEPDVFIDSPTQDSVVTTPVPRVQFHATTSGNIPIVSYSAEIRSENVVIWSKSGNGPLASGANVVLSGNPGDDYFDNDKYYSLRVSVTDQNGLTATSPLLSFRAAWAPATTPTGVATDVNSYNDEDQGFVAVTWTDAGTEPEYLFYTVERKVDLIDPYTNQVLEEGLPFEVYRTYERLATYTYRDFTAPSAHKVSYRVRQYVIRFGDFVPSDPTAWVASYPQSDGYWLIDPLVGGDTANAFKIHNVTTEDYTEDYEESEYPVIGRGYHVDQGERLGYKGSLGAQLRHTGNSSARQKKLRLERIKENPRKLYLRNPFGDIFRVHVGNMSWSRIAGVGLSEFCDITIPYTEVGE